LYRSCGIDDQKGNQDGKYFSRKIGRQIKRMRLQGGKTVRQILGAWRRGLLPAEGGGLKKTSLVRMSHHRNETP
jgi:hypothetical protein